MATLRRLVGGLLAVVGGVAVIGGLATGGLYGLAAGLLLVTAGIILAYPRLMASSR